MKRLVLFVGAAFLFNAPVALADERGSDVRNLFLSHCSSSEKCFNYSM